MRTIFVLLTLSALCSPVLTAERLDAWLRSRIEARVLTALNSNHATRQREGASVDSRSTSLVDQSSATDFVNMAMTLSPVASGGAGSGGVGQSGTGMVTASAYSLLAAINGKSLTDPEFYKQHTAARQLSFTLGSTASDVMKDNTDKAGTTFGFKFTPINHRDIYGKRNATALTGLRDVLRQTAVETELKSEVSNVLFCLQNAGIVGVDAAALREFCATPREAARSALLDAWGLNPSTLSQKAALQRAQLAFRDDVPDNLPAATLAQIDGLIEANLPALTRVRAAINDTYDQIKQGMQLAIATNYINRPDAGTNDLRASLIFDYGLSPRVNWTMNGSFDHRDRKMALDTKGGRFATEFLGRLTGYEDALWGRQPITLAFAGEGKWLTRQKPQYSVQAKLTIPISAGLDFPIVYRWAKRIDLVDKEGKELKMGLSVDLGSLSQLLKGR